MCALRRQWTDRTPSIKHAMTAAVIRSQFISPRMASISPSLHHLLHPLPDQEITSASAARTPLVRLPKPSGSPALGRGSRCCLNQEAFGFIRRSPLLRLANARAMRCGIAIPSFHPESSFTCALSSPHLLCHQLAFHPCGMVTSPRSQIGTVIESPALSIYLSITHPLMTVLPVSAHSLSPTTDEPSQLKSQG